MTGVPPAGSCGLDRGLLRRWRGGGGVATPRAARRFAWWRPSGVLGSAAAVAAASARGACAAGLSLALPLSPARDARNDDPVADLHQRVRRDVVGLGDHRPPACRRAAQCCQGLARRDDVDAEPGRQRIAWRTDRRGRRHRARLRRDPRLRRRSARRRPLDVARDHEMLAGIDRCRAGRCCWPA